PTTSGFEDLNGNAITVAGEGRVRTDFFDLTGHQLLGSTVSNKRFISIDQRLRLIIEVHSLTPEKGSLNIFYNFYQYSYVPKKGADRGIGVFGRLGVSDGNPNFMKFFGSFGVGGKGMFESHPSTSSDWATTTLISITLAFRGRFGPLNSYATSMG